MDKILYPANDRSPLVDFDFDARRFLLDGESYPEDAAAFFGPLLESLSVFLKSENKDGLVFDLKLAYFNSSSAKALMNMFQMLEEAAENGLPVTINWHYHPDDDTMEEFGEDFSEDFGAADFKMRPIEG